MYIFTNFNYYPRTFSEPEGIICAHNANEVSDCFSHMEKFLAKGYFLAGFFSYEMNCALEERLLVKEDFSFPLLYFGIFHPPKMVNLHDEMADSLKIKLSAHYDRLNKPLYLGNIQKIKSYIEEGEVYQINYCVKLDLGYSGNPRKIFLRLFENQPVPFSSYIETDQFQILSLSPEKFIDKNKNHMTSQPMKGTLPRGRKWIDDLRNKIRLGKDPKNRTENLMITDLLRNDLGRIGTSVRVPKLFEVRRYNTLFQMTSTITAKVKADIPLQDAFRALFPSGSVTGAPKIRAIEIIRRLEDFERKIYTGSIGYITPQKNFCFNIAIRTILLHGGKGEMGIGSGIVWDSDPEREFEECLLKSDFLKIE